MQFQLLDRITSCVPGKELAGKKRLTLAEEYLADHFPGFPIMPGVLQLQSLIEAGCWLLRITDEFQYSVVVVREVKTVKYGTLMQPGKVLDVAVELASRNGPVAVIKGKGEAEGIQTVSAQFSLQCYNLRDRNPVLADRDLQMVKHFRDLHLLLSGRLG